MASDCIYFLSAIKGTPAASLYQPERVTSLFFTGTLQWNCGCRVKMFMQSIITSIPRGLLRHGNVTTCEPRLTSELNTNFSFKQINNFQFEDKTSYLIFKIMPVWASLLKTFSMYQYGTSSIFVSSSILVKYNAVNKPQYCLPVYA